MPRFFFQESQVRTGSFVEFFLADNMAIILGVLLFSQTI